MPPLHEIPPTRASFDLHPEAPARTPRDAAGAEPARFGGEGPEPVVSGERAALPAWLTGRDDGAGPAVTQGALPRPRARL